MSTGNKTDFYNINVVGESEVDVDYICNAFGFTFAEGNAFKALVGIAKHRQDGSVRHSGTTGLRDANKLVHYADQIRTKTEVAEMAEIIETEHELKIGLSEWN